MIRWHVRPPISVCTFRLWNHDARNMQKVSNEGRRGPNKIPPFGPRRLLSGRPPETRPVSIHVPVVPLTAGLRLLGSLWLEAGQVRHVPQALLVRVKIDCRGL